MQFTRLLKLNLLHNNFKAKSGPETGIRVDFFRDN